MPVELRAVEREDHASTRNLVTRTFKRQDVAPFLEALRADRCLVGQWLAQDSSGPFGFIAFARVEVEQPSGVRAGAAIQTPLAVRPERQHVGVGKRLGECTIEELQERGETLCFMLGDPEYYGRFGFQIAMAIASPWAGNRVHGEAYLPEGTAAPAHGDAPR